MVDSKYELQKISRRTAVIQFHRFLYRSEDTLKNILEHSKVEVESEKKKIDTELIM
jgi:hypothetical protein